MQIYQATTQNVEIIARIHVSCWKEVYPYIPEKLHKARSLEYRIAQWHDVLQEEILGSRLFVVQPDVSNDIVGFCYCKPNDDTDIIAKSELHAAYVLPEFRGGKTGPVMMDKMVSYLSECELEPMCLWVFNNNPISRWYRMLGWKGVVKRDRIINGIRIPETGYVCHDIPQLKKRLKSLLSE